jgi:class 3 adenylate cyclase
MAVETTMTETAIILVTDLQGSTELRSRVGEELAEEVRREHDRLLHDAVTQHGGVVVKGLGDGILARFDGATDAVSAAVTMQQAVDVYTRAHVDTPLSIRVGISAGDVSLEDEDCFGTPVIEASRLCADAQGGQIFVAELVRLLARGRGGHGFRTIGERELKGLTEAVLVDEVTWERLEEERPDRDASATLDIPMPRPLASTQRFAYAGRGGELDQAWAAWKASTDGRRQIVLLSGEPGMGKTRLATEIARKAHAEGAVVLFGRADEDVDTPYRPVLEAVRHLIEHSPVELLDAHVGECGPVLARLVPDLARRTTVDTSTFIDEGDRTVLFDAIVDLLARASRSSPVVLVLDDLHWADHPSLLFLRHLARAGVPMAVTVLGTYRDTDLVRTHPLSLVLADLRREPDVCRIALDGLDQGEIEQLMVLTAGEDIGERADELAAAIASETGGNPFFVGEVLIHLVESGGIYQGADGKWTTDATDLADLGVPEGVREVVGRRLSALSEQANEALAIASVLGFEFDAGVVAEMLGTRTDDVVDALEHPVQRGLLAEAQAVDRYRFPHALVRQTLYEELSMSRRIRLHARAVDVLEKTGKGALEERANHAVLSAAVAAPERAMALAEQAARAALDRLAYEQAVGWYRRALEAEEIIEPPDPARRADLLIGLVHARNDAGEAADARSDAAAAADLARKAGDSVLLARAAIAYGGQFGAWLAYDDTLGLALAGEALAAVGTSDPGLRAQLYVAQAGWLRLAADIAQRNNAVHEAAALAADINDPVLAFRVLHERAELVRDEFDPALHIALAEEFEALPFQVPAIRVQPLYIRLTAAGLMGDLTGAAELARQIAELADETGHALPQWMARTTSASLRTQRGRFDEAEALIAAARHAGDVLGITAELVEYSQLMQIAEFRGRWDDYDALWDRYRVALTPYMAAYPVDAVSALARGDLDRAASLAEQWFVEVPRHPATGQLATWEFVSRLAPVISPVRAAQAYAQLEPYHELWIFAGPEVLWGSCERALARYAARMGRADDAIAHLERALESHERAGDVPQRAMIELDLATALAQRDAPGDGERVLPLAASALATADHIGLADVHAGATALV